MDGIVFDRLDERAPIRADLFPEDICVRLVSRPLTISEDLSRNICSASPSVKVRHRDDSTKMKYFRMADQSGLETGGAIANGSEELQASSTRYEALLTIH